MQSVLISIINGGKHPISHLTVPVLDQSEIILRVQDFLNKKNEKREEGKKKKMSECRKLFQNNNCELFAFPTKRSPFNAFASGELFFCSFFKNTGVVLCFFPIIDDSRHRRQTYIAPSIFNGTNYPECNDPFTAFLSPRNISFLIFEEGSINTNTANNCMLSGVEFMLLKHNFVKPTLLCKKTDDRKIAGSSILVKETNLAHQSHEHYIFINCLSEEEGFDIQLKFPILTEQAVKEKILQAQMLRSKSLNTTCLNLDADICKLNIFHSSMNRHCLFFFPIEISFNLPFHGLTGGKVYFSYKEEDKSLQVTVWSDFFESDYRPDFGYVRSFSTWQVNKFSECHQKNLLGKKIFIFQDPNIKLVQVEEFQYLLKNAKMQFIFQDRSLGLFFFRTKEPDQSSQSGKTGPISSSIQSSTSQTSTCTINPQVCSPQWSINLPYTQSSSHPPPSMINPQIGPSQGSMGMSCAQTYSQAENPPHASMRMPSFYTEGSLDSSQLTFEDINQISEETWEQLNVILHDVSTDDLLTLGADNLLTLEADDLLTLEADDLLTLEADDLLTLEADDLLTLEADDLLTS